MKFANPAWKLAAALLATVSFSGAAAAASSNGLSGSLVYYDTSGGSILTAYKSSVFPSFTKKTGVNIIDDFNNGDSHFFAAVRAGRIPWSVVAFNTVADGLRAAKQGYLLPVDTSIVPVDKLEDGAYGKYGIRGIVYGIALTWSTKKWPESGPHPTSWKDFYDTAKFPGKRCMYKGAQSGWVLESALLASGTSAKDLYPLDVKKALAKLDTIKKDVVWWTSGAQSVQLLATGECDMGILWSGRVLTAVNEAHLPLAMTWNGAGFTSDYIAVPKNAPNPKAGMAFLAHWITDHEGQISFVNQTGYPTRIKGLPLSAYNEAARPFLAAGTNLDHAIMENDEYYRTHVAKLSSEFTRWLAGY